MSRLFVFRRLSDSASTPIAWARILPFFFSLYPDSYHRNVTEKNRDESCPDIRAVFAVTANSYLDTDKAKSYLDTQYDIYFILELSRKLMSSIFSHALEYGRKKVCSSG